jgi:sialic acid synthase SpsE
VFRDHKVSLTAKEVLALQKVLQEIQALRGSRTKLPQPIEIEQGHVTSFRRGSYLKRPFKAGETIKKEDLVYLRPNHGVDARDSEFLADTRSQHELQAFQRIDPPKEQP